MGTGLEIIRYCIIIAYYFICLCNRYNSYIQIDVILTLNEKSCNIVSKFTRCQNVREKAVQVQVLRRYSIIEKRYCIANSVPITSISFPLYDM